jgi:hypothetical protein
MVYSEISKLWKDIINDTDVRLSAGPTSFIIKVTAVVYIGLGTLIGFLNWKDPPIECYTPRVQVQKDPIAYCWDESYHTGIGPDANERYHSTFKFLPTYYICFATTFFLSTIAYRYLEKNSISYIVNVPQEISQRKENPEEGVLTHRVQLIFKGTLDNSYFMNYFGSHVVHFILACCHVYFLSYFVFQYPKVNTFGGLIIGFNPYVIRENRTDHLGLIFPKYFGCTMKYFDQGKQMKEESLLCYTTYMTAMEASVVVLFIILIVICFLSLYELILTQIKVLVFENATRYEIKNFQVLKALNFSQRLKLILLEKNIDSEQYHQILEKLVIHPKVARHHIKENDLC